MELEVRQLESVNFFFLVLLCPIIYRFVSTPKATPTLFNPPLTSSFFLLFEVIKW